MRSELRGERGVGHIRAGGLGNIYRVADAELHRDLGVVAGDRLRSDALSRIDDVVAADLGNERVVLTDRQRNRHRLIDDRLVLDAELRRHGVVGAVAGAQRFRRLVDQRAVLGAGLERGLGVGTVLLVDLGIVLDADLTSLRIN